MKYLSLVLIAVFGSLVACNSQEKPQAQPQSQIKNDTAKVMQRTEKEWQEILSPQEFAILRLKGTDRAFTGKYYLTTDDGVYHCAGCGAALFTSEMKFASECGWPSFDRAMEGGKIKTKEDFSHGMLRTEILCAKCGGHLGHLFDDGPTNTGLRYCVNSTSLNFVKSTEEKTSPK